MSLVTAFKSSFVMGVEEPERKKVFNYLLH